MTKPTSDEVAAGYRPPVPSMVAADVETDVPAAVVSGADLFNPSAHTVADVVAHLNASDHAEVARVIAAELSSQARKGVLEYPSHAKNQEPSA